MNKKLNPTVIGIDIGSFTTKIAAVQNGAVDLITNEANFRQTPSVIGYGEGERKIGESGNVKLKSNYKNTVVSPMRFLGVQGVNDDELIFCPCPSKKENGQLIFQVNYQKSKRQLKPQQILASYFTQLKSIIAHNNLDPKLIVITVPFYFTQTERLNLLNAAEIANLNNVKIVHESIATGLDFGMFKKKEMQESAKNIAFIDFGHSKLTASLLKFSSGNLEVLVEKFNRNLGCRNIDIKIFEAISESFKEKTGLNILDNKKAFLKLMEAIQRQRKIISGINSTDISIECFMEDEDLCETLSRQKMVQVASQVFEKIEILLKQFKEQVEKKGYKIDMIELVGGGTRIPAVIELIKNTLQLKPSRTINSSQTIARGAGLFAVKKSGLFRFIDYSVKNKVRNSIKAQWKTGSEILYEGNQILPCEKVITIKTEKELEITVEKLLIKINEPKNQCEIQLRFEISEEGIISLNRVQQKQGQKITYTCENLNVLSSESLKKFKQFEREMYIRDFQIIKSYEKKNELETTIYQQKQKLRSAQILQFFEPEVIDKRIKELQKLSDDIDQENIKLSIQEYDEKIKSIHTQMKGLESTIQEKRKFSTQYFEQLAKLKKYAQSNLELISSNYRNTTKVVQVYENIKAIYDWILDLINISKQKKIWELPLVNPSDLQEKYKEVEGLMSSLNKPSPRRQYHEEPQFSYQRPQQKRMAQTPKQQYYDPFGMKRSGTFGNSFFNNMGSFF